MIEKLKLYSLAPSGYEHDEYKVQEKINQLVEAVNAMQNLWLEVATVKKIILELQTRAKNVQTNTETRPENMQDNFAERCKWIGKLCRFRDNPACEWKYGILYKVFENAKFPFWDTDCYEYAECEPVKPTDSIIYKGGDNE